MFWLDGRLSIRSGYPGRLNGQTRLPGCAETLQGRRRFTLLEFSGMKPYEVAHVRRRFRP